MTLISRISSKAESLGWRNQILNEISPEDGAGPDI